MQGSLPAKALSYALVGRQSGAGVYLEKRNCHPNPGQAKLAVSYGHSIGELVMEHSDQQSLVGGKHDIFWDSAGDSSCKGNCTNGRRRGRDVVGIAKNPMGLRPGNPS
jgi:hypothetical protein